MDDEQFLMDMIASGSGGGAHVEEAGDGSNTDMCLTCPVMEWSNPNLMLLTRKLMYKS